MSPPFSIPAPRSGPLPVTVLCGFLGSGETTLLKRLLRESAARRFAVLVNDLSELAVDAELIGTAREGRGDKLVNLNRGSLGGALREKFRAALDALEADETTDYLLIETSGGTQPAAIVEELTTRPGVRLDTFATVVDGLNLLRDHDSGRALLDSNFVDPSSPIAQLRAQIAPASVLLISKADLLKRPQAEAIIAVLQQLNPRATIITMAYGSVKPEHLLDARTFRLRKKLSTLNSQLSPRHRGLLAKPRISTSARRSRAIRPRQRRSRRSAPVSSRPVARAFHRAPAARPALQQRLALARLAPAQCPRLESKRLPLRP